MKTQTIVVLVPLLVACVKIQTGRNNFVGVCFVQESIPNSGSTVTGGEGESVSFYCRVLREINRTQVATEWFIERIGAGGSGPQTIVGDSNFNITGEPLPNSGLSSQTNLTIQSLTSDLDRATLSCGLGGTPPTIEASFILRIYRPPNLVDNLPVVGVEGSTNTVTLRQAPDAFPFPQQFSWTMNGSPASNNSRVTFGYPSVTFQPFEQADAGTYTLNATNYRLDNTSVVVGMDTGSFTFSVQCLCFLQQSISESGSTVAGNEGESVSFYCRVLNEVNGTQVATEWFIERIGTGGSGLQLIVADSTFNITGEPLLNSGLSSQTNLTIRSLTSDLDRANLSCGRGGTPPTIDASTTLRVYRPPNLTDNLPVVAVEGGTFSTVSLGQTPDAFPFPQQFSWTVNGSPTRNNSRVFFGYPSVTFQWLEREDAGTYTLTATNYHLDNTSVVVGMDTGSFTFSVQYSPRFVGLGGDTQHVVLEGGNITLVCGRGVNGNPPPTISWLDNNGTTVSNGTDISGATTLSLTVSGVTRYQAGNWTCTAENSPGGSPCTVQHQIVVTVVVPPSHPINVSIQSMDIGPTFARVHWQAPLFRGIPRVSHYEIKVTQVNGSADPFTFSTTDSTRDFNVTGLSPGTRYEICVAAICERIVGHSPPSDPVFANTTTTVPAPMCPTPPTSSNSVITVHWNYTHTGGLKLTQVIVTAYMGILANIQLDVPNGNLTDLSQMSLDIATFTAGFQYTFQVTAYNQFGSSTAQCDPVMHLIGIPHVPDTPTGVSRSSGSVVLTLRTPASGRMPSSEMFSFIVNFTQPNSIEGSRTLEASDYIDGQNHQFTIDGLMEGEQYVFSAQAQNQFGYSKFSGNSDFITINGEEDLQPRVTGVSNVAVGIAVVVTSIIAFVVGVLAGVLMYHCISKHRSQFKLDSSSHQQQQTDPEYEEVPAIIGKKEFELKANVAYEPSRH